MVEREPDTSSVEEEPGIFVASKRPYERPVLEKLGLLRSLTKFTF